MVKLRECEHYILLTNARCPTCSSLTPLYETDPFLKLEIDLFSAGFDDALDTRDLNPLRVQVINLINKRRAEGRKSKEHMRFMNMLAAFSPERYKAYKKQQERSLDLDLEEGQEAGEFQWITPTEDELDNLLKLLNASDTDQEVGEPLPIQEESLLDWLTSDDLEELE